MNAFISVKFHTKSFAVDGTYIQEYIQRLEHSKPIAQGGVHEGRPLQHASVHPRSELTSRYSNYIPFTSLSTSELI